MRLHAEEKQEASGWTGFLAGRRYNRGVRLHKIMYDALMRLSWQRFATWTQENHKEHKTTVDSFFSEICEFYDDICETQFKKHMTSTSSVDFVKLFVKCMEFLWHKNGKLSKFWLSYLDMVEILLRLRASSQGKTKEILDDECSNDVENDKNDEEDEED